MTTLEILLKNTQDVKVIDASIDYKNYTPLDLSSSNTDLSKLDLGNAIAFEDYIENHLSLNHAKVAYGGYIEERNLYKRSANFNDANVDERNIHIGLDLWIKAGTPVLAALDGKVHSFNNNSDIGDYGPTIILEHNINEHTFYTLYGHLSLESIENIKIGDSYKKGQLLATLGDASVNGDYSPHLHFQIIKNIGEKSGDYPGVCSKKELDYYLDNCPDPNFLVKIE
ncbi:peptidoglycan DD-metalloendopeptidase family protein [Flavobacterium sp. K5-23]|uniref:peptidoglycan DD-metalloendopeptidase family protein n=1 Tax=Flavobacterium sp. K5-23 TaxID=2746225 RepID=UPI00200E6402|nr:peptidoglycan DD-metalloendopeptidase family protein [Flavobacterium sp. K5-23]UQD57159.1 peptidoglycan DD-metalloendopeptidase family protein [Flavobacterium sp. K5-23]